MTKTSDSIEKDGKTWHWCPHHKVDGTYDGLYVTHRPEEYEDWKKNKFQFRREKFQKDKKKEDEIEKSSNKSLMINDNLKAALLTHSDLTGAQIDKLMNEANAQADF